MSSSEYFPISELKPNDVHKINVFNALFQAYKESENRCSGRKTWKHMVIVAQHHPLCKEYGIRLHNDTLDTYPVYDDVNGKLECFGFAHDNWDRRTHCTMHHAMSKPDAFKKSPYYKHRYKKTIVKNNTTSDSVKPSTELLVLCFIVIAVVVFVVVSFITSFNK